MTVDRYAALITCQTPLHASVSGKYLWHGGPILLATSVDCAPVVERQYDAALVSDRPLLKASARYCHLRKGREHWLGDCTAPGAAVGVAALTGGPANNNNNNNNGGAFCLHIPSSVLSASVCAEEISHNTP